ncbi:MAG: STAS domain-containing protein [Streptosporangiaceae bacterium]
MDLALSTRDQDDCTVVTVSGELDLSNAPGFRARLREALTRGSHRVVVDLAGLQFIDSTGLSALIAADQLASHLGGRLCLAAPRGPVSRVLGITGLSRHFRIFPSVADATADTEPTIGGEQDLTEM